MFYRSSCSRFFTGVSVLVPEFPVNQEFRQIPLFFPLVFFHYSYGLTEKMTNAEFGLMHWFCALRFKLGQRGPLNWLSGRR